MFPHLPQAIFWEVVKCTDDIKTCVALWSSHPGLFSLYSPEEFWKNMCYYHFSFSNNVHQLSWCDVYWWLHGNIKGCSYCNRTITPKKDGFNECNMRLGSNMNIYVCQKCKNLLGDSIIHKNQLDPWKVSIMKRLRGHRYGSIFNSYFGEKQIERCHSFNMKCAECLKNVRNVRCPHDMCGICCNCKYHKSHYIQATPGDIVVSFDIYALINTSSGHQQVINKKTHKHRHCQRRSMIVHKFS